MIFLKMSLMKNFSTSKHQRSQALHFLIPGSLFKYLPTYTAPVMSVL